MAGSMGRTDGHIVWPARPGWECDKRRSMSDGREERDETEKRHEQEKRENREDRIDRGDVDEWEPERADS